ncbi:uncharacterized protein MELLADRAFT_115595 [Melampsora larici-populina 98AG31]|uniref:Brix domain-containing protein n=1 Tax=Melampsora larici-populina (strain 98AG31 / pathotype 3-4-7) TaxID=747676 RepID=F4RBZ0_MELLP|nr:uncharacterized protein MELLADRAFT_115595 [Melampsora larici-populina 98AG31]EGG10187.1 hypothetical protein MELLADRAFT_115595 [Melampsora larici-populina 98AG31]
MSSRAAQAQALAGSNSKRKQPGEHETSNATMKKPYKSKVLILCSRGITYRMRHLMNDISDLVTHGKKDAKLDSKHALPLINELADLSSCNYALYFESRRRADLYLWASGCPNGPSIRFHVVNSHTIDEMKMTGNCLKGSRPILQFGQEFDSEPSWRVCKEVLTNIFAVPKTAKRAKPFVDHVITFSVIDGKIWFRNYQILEKPKGEQAATTSKKIAETGMDALSLSEIGPRFVLVPIKIFEGSFGGPCLWENKEFVPPFKVLKQQKSEAAAKYAVRKEQEEQRTTRQGEMEANKIDDGMEKRVIFA